MIQQSDSIVDNVRSPQPMIVCLCYHSSVIAIKFANDDKGRLACASRDGTLSVFNVSTEPPSLLATLSGHRRPVNGTTLYLSIYPSLYSPCQISTGQWPMRCWSQYRRTGQLGSGTPPLAAVCGRSVMGTVAELSAVGFILTTTTLWPYPI